MGRDNKKKGSQAKTTSQIMDNKACLKLSNHESSKDVATSPMGLECQKGVRVKGMALKVDTKLAQEVVKGASKANPAKTKPAPKGAHAEVRKPSEAMMNKNWRNHRHDSEHESHEDDANPIWSAPPEKSQFYDQERDKPRRNDENEAVDCNGSLERVAYRCRKPEEVRPELVPFTSSENVDAGLCLSAPATKLEFHEAEIGGDERAEKYHPSIFQSSVKSVVRLDHMEPVKRAGYEKVIEWDEKANLNGRLQESSASITAMSAVNICNDDWDKVEFPLAEMWQVKGERKFPVGLSGVEQKVRKQLSELVEPQSAGLPPEYLRKHYEELREGRRKAMSIVKSRIEEEPALKELPDDADDAEPEKDSGKDSRLNALLGKLNRLCAPRMRAFTVDGADGANKENINKEHSPSGDSGVSGLSPESRKRSSSLNPAAVEFHCPKQMQPVAVGGCASTMSGLSASASTIISPAELSASMDPIKLLETRVAELEAQIARQQTKQLQLGRQRWADGYDQTPFPAPYVNGQNGYMAGRGVPHIPAINRTICGPSGYTVTPTFPVNQQQHQPGYMPGVGRQANPVGPTTPYAYGQANNGLGAAPNAMGAVVGCSAMQPMRYQGKGFAEQSNTAHAIVPRLGPGFFGQSNVPQATAPYQGRGTIAPGGAGSNPSWVKSVFGPKPVAKPKGPFRPGDTVQALRQQQYEEYLEHLRATDPTYAMKCKQRQARRADRRRQDTQSEGASIGTH
ncbi:hypothetical protein GGS20DRAFT_149875 [Poronia punctata]|nr:hypothetical protein GGS20DRAFT_149875 [Poronia punctata]